MYTGPRIDTHAHFGNEAMLNLERTSQVNPLVKEIDNIRETVGYKSMFDESTSLETLIEEMDRNMIEIAWLHQLSFKEVLGYDVLTNEEIQKAIEKYPERLKGFAGIDPRKKDAPKELEYAIKDMGLHGFKMNPNDFGGYFLDDREVCYPLYEKALELDIPVSIHTGITPGPMFRMKHNNPLQLDDVAVDFPELTIFVEHIGFPWQDLTYNMVQRHKNMYITITAVANIMIHKSEALFYMEMAKMLGMIGSERILWGSDWTATPNIREVLDFFMHAEVPFPVQMMKGPTLTDDRVADIVYMNAVRLQERFRMNYEDQ